MPIQFFRCEKCRREFPNAEAAKQCEATHHAPVSVVAKSYTIYPYPHSVEVAFPNGESRVYLAEGNER